MYDGDNIIYLVQFIISLHTFVNKYYAFDIWLYYIYFNTSYMLLLIYGFIFFYQLMFPIKIWLLNN